MTSRDMDKLRRMMIVELCFLAAISGMPPGSGASLYKELYLSRDNIVIPGQNETHVCG